MNSTAAWASQYLDLKTWLMASVPLAKDALHIHVALAIFVAVRLVWRWRGGWMLAWIAALAAALAGEYFDRINEGATSVMTAYSGATAEHWQDIWNGMAWPTILLVVGRWLQPRRRQLPPASGDVPDRLAEQSGEQPVK